MEKVRLKIVQNMLDQLKDVDDALNSIYKNCSYISPDTSGKTVGEEVKDYLDEINTSADSEFVERIEDTLESLYDVYRADNYGISLPKEYLEVLKELLK